MSIADVLNQAIKQISDKYGQTSWWNDYLNAEAGGKESLWNWMHSIDTGESKYSDWTPDAAQMASQRLAMAQEHTRNVFGYNMNENHANRLGSAGATLGKVGMLVGGAIAGGAALGGAGVGAEAGAAGAGAGAELGGSVGAETLAGGAAADTLGGASLAGAADAGVYGVSGIESAAAPALTGGATAAETGGFGGWLGELGGSEGLLGGAGGAMDMTGSAAIPGAAGMEGGVGTGSIFSGSSGLPDWLGQATKLFGPTVANGLINGFLGNRARQQAGDLLGQSNALNQPQRQPYQQMSQNLLSNPQDYMQNNPFAKSMTDLYKNNVIPANVAKSGNTGFEADRLGSQFATSLAGNYNTLAQVLAGYGGFNQGASNVGAVTPLYMNSNQNYNEMFRGVGDAASKIFGTPTTPQQPQTNPVTGSTVMPQ